MKNKLVLNKLSLKLFWYHSELIDNQPWMGTGPPNTGRLLSGCGRKIGGSAGMKIEDCCDWALSNSCGGEMVLPPLPRGLPRAPASSYVSSGVAGVSSRHHLVFRSLSTCFGVSNFKWHVSFGMMVHSCFGCSFGTNLVWNLQIFWGLKSQTSSGTSINDVTVLSWHSSGPVSVTHPAPQISTGSFSHLVSPTNLPFVQNEKLFVHFMMISNRFCT